jgi:hypothetical protein
VKKAFTLIELPRVIAVIAVLMGIPVSSSLPGRSIVDDTPTEENASILDDAPDGIGDSRRYDSYKGLIMTGYQGWFNAPGDGADKDWTHYQKNGVFKPGHCTIDFWPDITEYEKTYKTAFRYADGSPGYVFSSYDASTTDLHFRWMADYGIDGAFMQRFIHRITKPTVKNHYHVVFASAMQAATKYDRAISIRYDLTGMAQGYSQVLLADLDEMIEKYDMFKRVDHPTFLHHNGKPLIAIGGVGFSEDIAGTHDIGYLDEAEIIIAGLAERGFSIMIRVPARWREFGGSAIVQDSEDRLRFHQIIKTCDILMPWHVGAYREESYRKGWPQRITDDMNWCQSNNMDYVPVIFPGFSRFNLKGYDDGSFRPRNNGSFFWLQASSAIHIGAEMLFLAQFDEMDEGTQYFKCVRAVPISPSPFIPYEEDIQSDHYLWLAGKAGEMLRAKIPFSTRMPERVFPDRRSH